MKLCLLGVVLATGCVANNETLSQSQAKSAGDSIGTSVEASAAMFGPMDQTANADGPPCVTLTGDPTDPDLDNIPTSGTLTYACSSTGFGLTGMLTGTLMLTDDQPSARAWAFTGTAALHASLAGVGGQNSIVIDRAGSIVASQATALGPFLLTHDVDQTTVITTGGGEGTARGTTTNIAEAAAWVLTFTPMATWTPGGLVVTGSLAATGSWNVTVDTASAAATLATPTPLVLTPSCATLVTAGVITATYPAKGGGNETVTVTWTACGQHTVERS